MRLFRSGIMQLWQCRDLVGLHARLSRKSNFTYELNGLVLSSATRFMPSDYRHTLQVAIIKLYDNG